MAIDIDVVRGCQRELNNASDEVCVLKRKMLLHQDDLIHAWRSRESEGVIFAMEEMTNRLSSVAKELEEIGNLIMITGQEILEEEVALAASSNVALSTQDINERTVT